MKCHWLAKTEPASNEGLLPAHPQIKGSVSLFGMTGIQTEITIPVHDISLLSLPQLQRQKVYIQYRLSWPNSFSTYERKATMSI